MYTTQKPVICSQGGIFCPSEVHAILGDQEIRLYGLKLSTQYSYTNHPEHIANLKKMNTGISLTPSDFELYETLSHLISTT